MIRIKARLSVQTLFILLIFNLMTSCSNRQTGSSDFRADMEMPGTGSEIPDDDSPSESILFVSPRNPHPGEAFRIFATGGREVLTAKIIVKGPSGNIGPDGKSESEDELPFWKMEEFKGGTGGKYEVVLNSGKKGLCKLDFFVSEGRTSAAGTNGIWKTLRGWDAGTETLYAAWINALFHGCDESASWGSLHEVTQNRERNFLYNYLSQGEDDPEGKNKVIMQPDCADDPFFLRAYFSWKLGLPFGYHLCDRGYVGHCPKAGQWTTNETATAKTGLVVAFNNFLRRVMNDVHSGTARTALNNDNSDYYPVGLTRKDLRPGVVYADPYGHTLTLVGWVSQTNDHPGMLLAVDAQPDGTVGIKRFWKGNFLFNTSGVVGEPGFKAFRPIIKETRALRLMKNKELTASTGFSAFSMQQKGMRSDVFYHTIDRLINPEPLDPETALLDQINALHEQLLVRVHSVDNGEAYFKSHPGAVIPMPGSANGIFLAGGQWEDFSTPNRDLRLLIAMDAVLGFPDQVLRFPEDFRISSFSSPEQEKKKLQKFLDRKVSSLSVSYTRSDGSSQELTLKDILRRSTAFEMAYNPNDGAEIRWGAPEKSAERSTCRRQAPARQHETMLSVRKWFVNRMHPPT